MKTIILQNLENNEKFAVKEIDNSDFNTGADGQLERVRKTKWIIAETGELVDKEYNEYLTKAEIGSPIGRMYKVVNIE